MNLIPLSFILSGLLALPAAAAGSSPAPALVRLDQTLTRTLQDKAQGRLAPLRAAELAAKFRTDLAAAKADAPPTPVNADLHAHILARLGELDPVAAAAGSRPVSADSRSALSRVHFDEKTTPAVLAEEKRIPWNETFNGDHDAQDGVIASGGRRIRFASRRAATSLLANLPTPPAPVNNGQSPSLISSVGLGITAALGAAGAMLLFGGWGGDEMEKRVPGIKNRMGMTAALGGVLATAGFMLLPAAPLASRPEIVNEVPQVLARVIPLNDGNRLSGMIGLPGNSHTFVTAAEDIASTPAAHLAGRLGIEEAPQYAIIRFPTQLSSIASRIVYGDNPLFIGRGLTSGGAREFQIPNIPIPPNAVIEFVKANK